MQISYVGAIDLDTDEEMDFWESDMDRLYQVMKEADMIVHYNGFTFDMPVIANYVGEGVMELPQIDLMHAAFKAIGFRPKLDDLAHATLGYGKIGKGTDAVKYWLDGDLESLRKYCLQDVRVTMDLYKYGRDHGIIKYFDKNGFIREIPMDWSIGSRTSESTVDVESSQPISMF